MEWDSGAAHDAKLARQREQRHKAREFEQRITREQVRMGAGVGAGAHGGRLGSRPLLHLCLVCAACAVLDPP